MYKTHIKRIFDLIIALLLLIVLAPIIVLIALLLRLIQGSAFFTQERPGLKERIFTLYKFKTMSDEQDENGMLLADEFRLKPFGKFIRSLSLDELPQLFNVLKGDMSLVGPRPLLIKYLPLYNETQKHRHDVRPGITGWAQVNGRNDISWAQKFEYDVYYVKHCSFLFDIKILWLTFIKVLKRSGINKANNATSDEFNGKN